MVRVKVEVGKRHFELLAARPPPRERNIWLVTVALLGGGAAGGAKQ